MATLQSISVGPTGGGGGAGFSRPARAELQFFEGVLPDGAHDFTGELYTNYMGGKQGFGMVLVAQDDGNARMFNWYGTPVPTCAVTPANANPLPATIAALDLGRFTARCANGLCTATAPNATLMLGPAGPDPMPRPTGLRASDGVACSFAPIVLG